MARMIPQLASREIIDMHGSESEVRVYGTLSERLPDTVTVLYSVPWIDNPRGKSTRDGEIDFVIIDPVRGVLILEVKGGSVEISSGGQWFTRGLNSQLEGITNPFQQGVTSKNVLKREINAIPGLDIRTITFGHSVVLPDVLDNPGNLGIEAPLEILILGDELESIGERIDSAFEYWNPGQQDPIDQELVDRIVERIFPQRILTPPLGVEVRSAEERIIELTDQQCRYLGFLGTQHRVLIEGPAGTGKTVLAFEKAKRLAESGISTLLTCFNKQLAMRLSEMGSEVDNLTVLTFHDACWKFAEQAGLELPAAEAVLDSKFFDGRLPELLFNAIELLPELRFGAVIVDEAQDLESEWWELLQLLLIDEQQGFFWALRDMGQNLFGRTSESPKSMQLYELRENVRNTKNIHDAAAVFASEDSGESIGPVGADVKYELATNQRATRTVLSKTLHRLIQEEGIRREDIAVLTIGSVSGSSLAEVDRVGAFELKPFGEEGSGVDVESVWRFKGLERPVVIVVDLSEKTSDAVRYVAMTRAKSLLVMIGDEVGLKR